MAEGIAYTKSAQQIELAINRLDSLSTLACIAAQSFSKLLQPQFSPALLADIVESDPALCIKILLVLRQQQIDLADDQFSIRRALDRLSPHLVRDAVLSIKVSGISELDRGPDLSTGIARKDLLLHSLAVACCAADIAKITSLRENSQLAYLAGLLHDIGKLALEEVMPKSFVRITEEAKSAELDSRTIEQKHLGVDHTILGKKLAQKWHLPEAIHIAIWLHHSDTLAISRKMPEAEIAQLVRSADSIVRRSGVGCSGSYDLPESIEQIAQSLGVNIEQIERIQQKLPDTVAQKSADLGLELTNATAHYGTIAHSAAAEFARRHTQLHQENKQHRIASSHLDFLTDLLLGIDSGAAAIDVAEKLATRWQRFYQTGAVCLYLVEPESQFCLQAAVVEALGQTEMVMLDVPEDIAPIPAKIAHKFAILDARDYVGWIFEQLEVGFNLGQTKLMPLLSEGKAIGAIIFEQQYPADTELFEEQFRTMTSIAGTVLDMVFTRQRQEHFAERFAGLICRTSAQQYPDIMYDSLDAVAELAAGIAHEFNNPLSVISGRAQLLATTETEHDKKESLEQIQDNVREASKIIEDLMSFAQPPPARPTKTDVGRMLNEAVQLASQKTDVEDMDVQIDIPVDIRDVYVDSAQIASAVANIISNSIESYTDEIGPIRITAWNEPGDVVKLQISDLGSGMDSESLQKSMHPFFSAKPAGRRRGMGLSYAARLIQINKGSLQIRSKLGNGTTVTILLPSP